MELADIAMDDMEARLEAETAEQRRLEEIAAREEDARAAAEEDARAAAEARLDAGDDVDAEAVVATSPVSTSSVASFDAGPVRSAEDSISHIDDLLGDVSDDDDGSI